MARNGSGIYSKPVGTTAVSGATIESAKFNEVIDDIAADLNVARPVVAGGTGAATASAARTALGLAIGSDVLGYNATIASLSGISPAALAAALGNQGPNVGNASLADEGIFPGFYAYDSAAGDTNGPAGATAGNFLHMRRAANGGEAQVFFADVPSTQRGMVYTRSRLTGVYSDWVRALNTDDLIDEDDLVSDDATKAPTQQSVKAYVDAGDETRATTAATNVPINSITTITHSLGVAPAAVTLNAVCTSANNGYAVGDRLMNFGTVQTSASARGMVVLVENGNTTQVKVIVGSGGLRFLTAAGVEGAFPHADWDFVIDLRA